MFKNIFIPKCSMQIAKQKICLHSLANSYKAKTVSNHSVSAVPIDPDLHKLLYSTWQSANYMASIALCANFNTLASFAC